MNNSIAAERLRQDGRPFPGAQNLHVIERITRADEDTILYQFTVAHELCRSGGRIDLLLKPPRPNASMRSKRVGPTTRSSTLGALNSAN